MQERAEAAVAGQGADDVWAEKEFAALPAMTIDQAMMLLQMHGRRLALGDEWGRLATRKRRGAIGSNELALERQIWWTIELARRAAAERRRERGVARARHYEETGNWFLPGEEVGEALVPPKGKGRKG